ncbi:MAG: response regulator transcription factor [Planctomycetota bacterium]
MGSEESRELGRGGAPDARPTAGEWSRIARSLRWSDREESVVRLLADGRSRRDVAEALRISTSTVQTHLQRAMWKAGVGDVVGLLWKVVEVRDRIR